MDDQSALHAYAFDPGTIPPYILLIITIIQHKSHYSSMR